MSVIIAINNNITYNKTGEYYTVKLFDVKIALAGKTVNYESRFLCLLTGVPQGCMVGTIILWDVHHFFYLLFSVGAISLWIGLFTQCTDFYYTFKHNTKKWAFKNEQRLNTWWFYWCDSSLLEQSHLLHNVLVF